MNDTDSALIVSSAGKVADYVEQVLRKAGVEEITSVETAGEARRLLINHDYNICVINAPLRDEHGTRLAQTIVHRDIAGVILCVRMEIFDEVSSKVEDLGILTVQKPISHTLFWNALKVTLAAHHRMQRMQSENRKLIQQIEDIRIIDRAKLLLISHLSLSEAEAHRYIEKHAMDARLTRREVAERILKTYEN